MADQSLDPAGGPGPLDPAGGAPVGPSEARSRAGRNLPAAIAVGVLLLVAVAASLWFRPEPFVALAVVAVGAALWELRQAFARRDIRIPLLPLLVGTAGMLVSAYAAGPEALLVAFVLTVGAVVVWRVLDGSGPQALRDAAAGVFAATYLPFLAGFVLLLLAEPQGELRVALFILLAVANDTGGYIAGVTFGRHPLAPTVSPKKTWEGLAGSVALTTAVGVAGAVLVLDAGPLLGVVLGVLTAVTATVGDLAESLIKRDLELKDMGSLLPGHGGVLDRLDSLVVTAPFVYLVLTMATSSA
ncbi:phosphatidate cytidylyltransferase [Isoptericola hypogeus]|uniref:Phosphatidate cytidylyltransferase n=1 Tax=Isoptericola hypogeus TaxID=300179 RepID=A0ABP4VMJ4_9MICO